ncbi:MotE family protein [Rhizobium sp. P40RR-XXII]|uniref:MotE family protein n=1 Tax=unclassified Rhizobium TaxID=2613769 RepID=UPI001457806F|nr:MotE family protein [Rhizobium sp. P28RR-XV]NLS18090.1 MotE family protein [Rhizobium sp. P40RR-XXII]
MILTAIARKMLIACSLATVAMLLPLDMAAAQEAPKPVAADPASSQDEIRQFCTNIADPARDQRYLLQKQELEKLQADVDQRIAIMDKRKAEYEDWLKRRDDFLKTADLGLVDIYKNMKPDAAAASLNDVRTTIAAAIIMKLSSRQSSLILAEMDAKKAAVITNIIASASDPNTSKSKDPS